MSELEFRLRRLMRLYPRSHRERREDEMVATFLLAAETGQTRPSLGDVWDVSRHGLARRLSAWDNHSSVTWRRGMWLGLLAWLLYVGIVQLGWLATGGADGSWWYSGVLEWTSAFAPLSVALLFLGGAPRTARLLALVAVVPIGGFYFGFGLETLRFAFPLAAVVIAPSPTFSVASRSILLAVAAIGGFAGGVALGAIPSDRVLPAARLVALIGSVALGFELGWRKTAAAFGLGIGTVALLLIAVRLQRQSLEIVAWLLLLTLIVTQVPLERRTSVHPHASPSAKDRA